MEIPLHEQQDGMRLIYGHDMDHFQTSALFRGGVNFLHAKNETQVINPDITFDDLVDPVLYI
jgi:hypothetical protein